MHATAVSQRWGLGVRRAPVSGSALATGVLVIAGAAAVALQWPDFRRFSPVPVILVCLGSVAFAAAALILASERAQRPNANLFALAAMLFAMEWAFTWPRTPFPFLALPFGQLFAVCLGTVLLRYPDVRIRRPNERAFVWCAVVFTVLARGLCAVTTRPEWFAFGIASGQGQLPASTLWWVVDANRHLSRQLAVVTDVGQLLVVPLFFGLIVRRVRRESRLVRAELLPVVIGAFLLSCVLMAHLIAVLVSAYRPAAAPDEWISGLLSLTVALIPLAFIVAGVQRRFARAAVADLVVLLGTPQTSSTIQDALRVTLGDDELDLLYRLPGSSDFVDTAGRTASGSPTERQPVVAPVTDRHGELLAVVRTSSAQLRHPGLLTSAVAASALAIENTTLETELRAQLQEVTNTRSRLVSATLGERRRLERDLHDGVQQQLLAVGATLGRLALRSERDAIQTALIDEVRDQLRRTRHELRLLARGLRPETLTQSGLSAALSAVAARLPVDVDIDVPPTRWGADVELTTYFVACEAVTNSVKHSGTARIAITVRQDGDLLDLCVSDFGRGGARFCADGGLAGLQDRVQALGGELVLTSRPDFGTTVEMTLPCG